MAHGPKGLYFKPLALVPKLRIVPAERLGGANYVREHVQ